MPCLTGAITGFHGTCEDFDHMKGSKRGTFGPGYYFVNSVSSAQAYGERVIEVNVQLDSPWRIHADWESPKALELDLESPCIEAVLSLEGGRALLEKWIAEDDLHYDQRLQNELLKFGYDGIIATYPDGSKEIVAFSADQFTITNHDCAPEPGHNYHNEQPLSAQPTI